MANNIKRLREERDWTQDHLAALMHTTRNQLTKLEKGSRRLSTPWINRAAEAFGLDPADIVREIINTPVVGLVGASECGARVLYDGAPGVLGFVKQPPVGSNKTVALEVRGNSMRGVAENGWFIYYDQMHGVDERYLGELCVVCLTDGRTLVKTPTRGRKVGTFDLESTNADIIRDVELEWISPVTCIIPRRFANFEDAAA